MNLRQRLLLAFSLTVIFAVAAVAYVVSLRTRQAFAQADHERTEELVAQFRHEFDRRGYDVQSRLHRMGTSELVSRIAFDIDHGSETSVYLNEASTMAQEYGLDFLEILGPDGTILTSAQWPARFGYKENIPNESGPAFLKKEDLPQGSALGLFAVTAVHSGSSAVYLLGGERVDRGFLQSLTIPSGTQVLLYRAGDGPYQPQELLAIEAPVTGPEKYEPLIKLAMSHRAEVSGIVAPTENRKDSLFATAIPLMDNAGAVTSVLLIGSPRRELIALQDHIRDVALTVGGMGILLAIGVTLWITGRITRPIVELATASRRVAAGDWNVTVDPHSASAEIADLAEAFNRMTSQLLDQRERLVQSERVAAWRELARRLAHELKNPLFPLQLTVENLVKARQMAPQEFDEIFQESTTTLMAEIQNLKTIIGRFSDFSKMPQPQLQSVDLNDIVERVAALHEPALKKREQPLVMEKRLDPNLPEIAVDPELLHRALSNLVLNAVDAMPHGGILTMRTASATDSVKVEVSDTGTGLTPEECERLFTPYYTTKENGTGLGLAIVQSVVADHGGTISVASTPGKGTTFIIELPRSAAAGAIA